VGIRWVRGAFAAVSVAALCACGGTADGEPHTGSTTAPETGDAVQLSVEIRQNRRDQVANRIQVAVHNGGSERVYVDQLAAELPRYSDQPPVTPDAQVESGQVVDLPWEYGEVRCDGAPPDLAEQPSVTLTVRVAQSPPQLLTLTPTDPHGLLRDIADRTCVVRQLLQDVDLRFADEWTLRREAGRDVLHGTLLATLRSNQPREITDLRGAILYGLEPGDPAQPLASLTAASPKASIPVIAFAARCDGHTIGEIKKPYEFLVWVGAPGEEPVAVTPEVTDTTKKALRRVCAF
jgi:hypothetical protein